MKELQVIRLGHPLLRKKSVAVKQREMQTKRFQTFLDNLATLCLQSNGAGIAAPQVGINKRVIVIHVDPKNPRYPDKNPFPLTIIVNPLVIKSSKMQKEDWEGDLSAGIRALVPRPITCIVNGIDRFGKEVIYNLQYDFHARVFQHEIDHLDGIFFIDKVKNKKTITELAEYEKYWKDK
ncbi:MAG: peptide deformylase [Candidatus Levyibacteriota bacterium]